MTLSEYRSDMETCCRCSACKFIPFENVKGYQNVNVCPSISRYNFHAYSGGGRLGMGVALLEKEIDYTPKLLEVVYNCQLCGGCDISCKYAMDMEVLEPIQAIRIACVESGHTLPVFEKMVGNLRQSGSLVAGKGTRQEAWFDGLNVSNKKQTGVLFHAGCRTAQNPALWNNAQAAVKLLQKAGVEVGVAGNEETCCGGRVYEMGYQADFLKQAGANVERLKQAGVKTLVTGCAECYSTFKVLYERFNLIGKIEVLHISQYLARLIGDGKLTPRHSVDMHVTYQDPCHLGRLGEPCIHWSGKQTPGQIRLFDPPKEFRRGSYGVYAPPRDVLQSLPGLKLSEMERTKEYAWCCGAGGGVQESNPQFARWTAAERVREAASTGAEALVTACPGCQQLLAGTAKKEGSALKVFDLVELVGRSVL